jgi:transcription elongation factor B subunit 1
MSALETAAPSKYITLVSADGFEFCVLRDAAMVSPIIKGMLDERSAFSPKSNTTILS